jgi:peptidoglycan/LPS O-acetylase OafA/YrhL
MPGAINAFGYGGLIAVAFRAEKLFEFLRRHRRLIILPLLFFLAMFVSSRGFVRPMFAMLLILVLTALENSWLLKVLGNRAFVEFGKLSYCIYLTHLFFLAIAHWILGIDGKAEFGIEWLTEIVIGLTITLAVAALSWKFFEKPLVDFGHRFKYQHHP